MDQYHDIIRLSADQLEEQLQTAIRFLSAVHPGLLKQDGFRPAIELRPIPRGISRDHESYYSLTWSLNLWDLSEKSVERLRQFLSRHNGQQTCLFYSVFTYDNSKKTLTKKGVPAKTGKITTAGALWAEEIALDFDNITFDDYIELVDRFEAMGLYALWVSSGHGFQAHILLDKPLDDKTLLKKFVYKFRSKGFACDDNCTDPARVMRLPGTFNKKCFKEKKYEAERANPPACRIVQESAERYSLDYILTQLDKLPTVSIEDEQACIESTTGRKGSDAPVKVSAVTPTFDEGEMARLKRVEYPYLSELELPDALMKILAYVPHGYRNPCMGFLIRFFKQQLKLSKNQIVEVLKIWSTEACDPAYAPDEFEADFKRLYYNYDGLPYTAALAKKFGSIDFQMLRLRKRTEIHIPYVFFEDFPVLSGAEVRCYLAIRLLEHRKSETTQEAIAEVLDISTRALRPTLQSLVKSGHCYLKKRNQVMQTPNTYHSSRMVSNDEGYMKLSYNDILSYISELCEKGGRTRANGDLKLYLFFRYKFRKGDIFMSQTNIGKHIGLEQNSISVSVSRLQERHFIEVEKKRLNTVMEYCEYTLLR